MGGGGKAHTNLNGRWGDGETGRDGERRGETGGDGETGRRGGRKARYFCLSSPSFHLSMNLSKSFREAFASSWSK